MRDALPQNLKLAAIEIAENLAANPRAYENRTKKLGDAKDADIYEHPDPGLQVTYRLIENSQPRLISFLHFAALKIQIKRTLFISYSHSDLQKNLRGTDCAAIWRTS